MVTSIAEHPEKLSDQEPLSNLLVGPGHTISDATHQKYFLGPLKPWTSFDADVRARSDTTHWSSHVLLFRHRYQTPAASLKIEHVRCGDETGVQGRFVANVGQVLSAACAASNTDLRFGDFKATALSLSRAITNIEC
ncbi:hypothetical protein P170DRAFT_478653 [Aspergillus steynii IBT 23096]|uniref:Uncharacterized protein n=1 Tax=Aspergillus steynii IBT 23096 TaxID=1392250 RepID=A0A2I2FYJ7_9EURO|nr:uncharacterized protein P170DRAFT_478653 [Aspergillus steynii IBT 23096]PLB45710.1 hypothetical protein P170DRAFT_478653 [Aspergillus steynii IBT 23096]